MSIELRLTDTEWECDLGVIRNGEGDPRRPIEPLILIVPDYVEELLQNGPTCSWRGGVHSAYRRGGATYVHLEYQGESWTWELREAHWWDHQEPAILLGVWPD